MKSAFLVCLVLCAAWPLRPGQDRSKAGPDESRLLALESAWNLAEENKDINALDQLLSDTLAYTDFDGTFMNKAQFLTSVKNSTPNSDQITNDDVTVHLYGSAVVSTSRTLPSGFRPFASESSSPKRDQSATASMSATVQISYSVPGTLQDLQRIE